jgi:hypothetical protein
MSCRTTLPGYGGYVPKFQTEYPTYKDVPAHKYEDLDIQHKNVMANSLYRSNYTHSHAHPQSVRSTPMVLPKGSKYHWQSENRQKTIDARDSYEYESRPTFWQTSYKAQHNGWQSAENASRSKPNSALFQQNNGPQHVMTARAQPTSYQRSYGLYGDNPRSRYVHGDHKATFSRRATTADLFSGTNKGSKRIPNYAGFVPGSDNNLMCIRDNIPHNVKDNLIQTYNHNLPGYTGHYPESVKNDHGPRNPLGKVPLPTGLHTGMVIGSMLEQ